MPSNKPTNMSAQQKSANQKRKSAERAAEKKARDRRVSQLLNAEKKKRDKELASAIKNAARIGVYKPKSTGLTPYRRKKAKSLIQTFGDFLNPDKFFAVPIPKKERKSVLDRIFSLDMSVVGKGENKRVASKSVVLLPKENYKRAKLTQDKKTGEFSIVRTGKTKRGPNAGKRYTSKTPLASVDELDRERDRLRRMGDSLGPLKGNETIAFIVRENGNEGYSHLTFKDVELLLERLDTYQKTTSQRINFYRHIEVVKVASSKQWYKEHPPTDAGSRGRKQRRKNRFMKDNG